MNKQITNKEFEKKLELLIRNIKKFSTILPNDKESKNKRIAKAKKDFFFFAQTYFPHYIRCKSGKPHKIMHEETEKNGQITAVAGFRGLGKTTQLSVIKPIWKALKEEIFFNAKIAKSDEKAAERTAAIRAEFLFNERIKQDFGEQLTSSSSISDFVIKAGCRFLALGYKTGIRGVIHMTHRPDYIDIDDLEDHQSFNERIAKEKLQFVTEEAYGALEDGLGYIIWLGNLTHQKSALNLLKKSTETGELTGRKMLIIKVDDGNFNPVWPEKHTKEQLIKIYHTIGRFGFERHFRMNPVVEGLKFKEAWFRYYSPEDIKNITFDKIVNYTDPSLGEKSTSDYKGSMTIGFYKKKYYLLECYLRRASITDMLKYLYMIHSKYNARLFMESNFWQKVLWDYIPPLAEIFGYLLPVSGVENREKKELRIERLEPYFEWGWLLFPIQKTAETQLLEDQLLGFPDFPYDDGGDALAGAVNALRINSQPETYESVESQLATQFSDVW
jgi:predicted phage terminase large subunit-like protein